MRKKPMNNLGEEGDKIKIFFLTTYKIRRLYNRSGKLMYNWVWGNWKAKFNIFNQKQNKKIEDRIGAIGPLDHS